MFDLFLKDTSRNMPDNWNLFLVCHKIILTSVFLIVLHRTIIVEFEGSHVCEHQLLNGKHEVSKQKEHFNGLLKAARDESDTKMPPVITGSKQELTEHAVLKRPLSDYDKISGVE